MFLFLYKVTAGRPRWRIVALCGTATLAIVLGWWLCHFCLLKLGYQKFPPA